MKSVKYLQIIHENDEWGTPTSKFRHAVWNYDIIPELDVCATEINRRCENYLTKEDDALTQEWDCDFFMNPPYSEITQWMEKAYTEHKKHNVDALILVYAKTDTKWWHKYVEGIAEVHFIKGRIKFNLPDGSASKNTAPYPSCWIIYRKTRVID